MENWNDLIKKATESWKTGGDKLGKELDRARELVKEKNYEEALKAYMTVFEEGRDTSPMLGVRLSYVLSETAELGKVYEPALTALLGYRNSHEQIMRSGAFSVFAIQEWSAFCENTDPNRKIEFYDLLKSEPIKNEELLENLRRLIWLDLIQQKRYEEFAPAELAQRLKETALMASQQFSPNSLLNSAMPHMAADVKLKEIAIKQLLQHSGAIFECAIALKKQSLAKKAFKLATYFQKTGMAYTCFIIAASRAGDIAKARKIAEDAKWNLPESEMHQVNAVKKKLNL